MIQYVWSVTETPCPDDVPMRWFHLECYRRSILTNNWYQRFVYFPFAISFDGEFMENMANLIIDDGISYDKFFEELGRSNIDPDLCAMLLSLRERFVNVGSAFGLTCYKVREPDQGPPSFADFDEMNMFLSFLRDCRGMLDAPVPVY